MFAEINRADARRGDQMNRRKIAGLTGMMIGLTLLAGCAKTPEDSLVKQKGKAAMEQYKEAGTEDAGAEGTGAEDARTEGGGTVDAGTGTEDAGIGGAEASTDAADVQDNAIGDNDSPTEDTGISSNALRTRLGAPETYQNESVDATGKLKILTDAVVEIPDAEKVPTIAVSQRPFEQELIDRITDTFFQGAVIYDSYGFYQMTKSDWQERLEELKGYAAQGNLDPYNFGTDENGNYVYDLNGAIEAVEQNIVNAPDERTYTEVHPQFGLPYDYGNGETGTNDDDFAGIVFMEDGTHYSYQLNRYGSFPMEVKIRKIPDMEKSGERSWFWSSWSDMNTGDRDLPTEEEVKSDAGISLEDAKKIADEKIQQIGLENMEVSGWDYVLQYYESNQNMDEVGYNRQRQTNTGYILHYTRKASGIPVTYTVDYGGSLEDMDSEMETWSYERLDIVVSKDGIEEVELLNLYDVGETRIANVELMPFSEIISIYEKMMQIQNADILNYENFRTYYVDRIVFGYGRIYEPATDSKSGLLVPVWNFFGSTEGSVDDGGTTYEHRNCTKYQSYLTINAVDGSVIDLGLGY